MRYRVVASTIEELVGHGHRASRLERHDEAALVAHRDDRLVPETFQADHRDISFPSTPSSRQGSEPLDDCASYLNVQLGSSNGVVDVHPVVGAFDLDDVPPDHVRGRQIPRGVLGTAH